VRPDRKKVALVRTERWGPRSLALSCAMTAACGLAASEGPSYDTSSLLTPPIVDCNPTYVPAILDASLAALGIVYSTMPRCVGGWDCLGPNIMQEISPVLLVWLPSAVFGYVEANRCSARLDEAEQRVKSLAKAGPHSDRP
jgi:hypothetical protein